MRRMYDEEGKIWLPPKRNRSANSTVESLIDILGRSPDQADALVLAVYSLFRETEPITLGALF
jgi:hypothetical protein